MAKRALSVLLALLLLLTLMPMGAMADGAVSGSTTIGDMTYSLENGVLTISGAGECTKDWKEHFDKSAVTEIVIKDDVTSIGEFALSDCWEMTSLTIGNSVKSIGEFALNDCLSLTDIMIPGSVETIADTALYTCKRLVNIEAAADSASFLTLDGNLYNKDKTELVLCPKNTAGSFTVPDGVTKLGEYAFFRCTDLTSVTLPDSMKEIGDHAFENCEKLESINIPDGVTSLGSCTFQNCEKLRSINIPDGVTEIGGNTFSLCTSLENVTIPDSVTIIGWDAFYGCSSFTSIVIPDSVTEIGGQAFSHCSGVESLTIGKNVKTIEYLAFADCTGLKNVTIGSGVTKLGDSAFVYCTSLESISIPINVTTLGSWVFDACTMLTDIYYAGTTAQWAALSVNARIPESVRVHCLNPFTDLTSDKYYYAPVLWAVNHDPQITGGYSDNTFRPQNTCTRAQIVTFIWRANGCPEPTSTSCTFTDVAPGAYYYKAVLWAVEKGITGGYNAATFGSNDTVTRAQAMTFLWRASDKPAAPDGTVNTFADVSSASYYYNAVLWAVANGITGGYNAQTFGSNDGCTRGQIVTFLYRSMK